MRLGAVVASCAVAAAALALLASPARAADECKGLLVCLPVEGPWVVVPVGGAQWELTCPLPNYVVAGTDARVAARDVDVSFRGETGSPVGPGVTTGRSAVFQAARTGAGAGASSFRPFIGCIPRSGGGGRALTGLAAPAAGFRPARPLFSVVVTAPVERRSQALRAACPARARLVGATHAVGFAQASPPTRAQHAGVRVRRTIVGGVVVARISATPAAGPQAEVQLRALCSRAR